jgi:hypothetical protein
MSGQVKVVLKKPISRGEDDPAVTELHLRDEITAGDLRGIKFSQLKDPCPDDILTIASRLCGHPLAVLNRMSLHDLGAVGEVIISFLGDGRETGNEPSP